MSFLRRSCQPSTDPGNSSRYCNSPRVMLDAPVPRTVRNSPKHVTADSDTVPETTSGSGITLSYRTSPTENDPSLRLTGNSVGKDSMTAPKIIKSMSWSHPEP